MLVRQFPPESQRRGHPTPFPEMLIYRLIKFYTYNGNIVLDMFGGTGTVAVVAQKTGRHFIHIDISKKYCEVAEQRLETAKMLEEFPLSIGRTGKTKMSKKDFEYVTTTKKARAKLVPQSQLLEEKTLYKPKKARTARKIKAK